MGTLRLTASPWGVWPALWIEWDHAIAICTNRSGMEGDGHSEDGACGRRGRHEAGAPGKVLRPIPEGGVQLQTNSRWPWTFRGNSRAFKAKVFNASTSTILQYI